MTGLEILDQVAYGHTLFHRDHDAWDLIDGNGLVAAVLCPRQEYLTVSLPKERMRPKPAGRRIPYGEKKACEIRGDGIEQGMKVIADLARPL